MYLFCLLQACDILFDPNFDYNDLYQAVVELLGAGSLCDVAARKDDKILDYMVRWISD